MLQIYTDAGYANGIAYAATLILEDWETMVAFFSERYENVSTCAEGEVLGVAQGLQWVHDNLPDKKEIAVYCDNLGMAQKLVNYVDAKTVNKGAYTAIWLRIYNLCDSFKTVDVFHIESHQSEHNPNKACDFLCHALIKLECTQS